MKLTHQESPIARSEKEIRNAARDLSRRDPQSSTTAAAAGTAATKPHPFTVPRCLEDGYKLRPLIAGWRCPECGRVSVEGTAEVDGRTIAVRAVVGGGA